MKRSISETARICGVSVRTLHYYDAIGLVCPSREDHNGYRFYDGAALARLQQVIFYRELGFSLKEIGSMFSAPDYDAARALREHRRLLELKRRQLDGLLQLVDDTLGGKPMKPLDITQTEIEETKSQYAEEARRRWGDTAAWKEYESRGVTPQQQAEATAEANSIFAAFAALRGQDPASPAVQALVGRWQAHITAHYYVCTPEILGGLGQTYAADERFTQNIDRFGPGTARLMSDAIAHFCAQ